MGFGGSASGMITSLKNNKRPRKSALKKYKNYTFEEKGELQFEKMASQKQLTEIRERIQAENKKRMRLYLILFTVLLVTIIAIVGFVKF